MKIKLRDMTKEQYKTWLAVNCDYTKCVNCPFRKVRCDFLSKDSWINNKDLHSDKFLNQEIEIKVELLTSKEKMYLENLLRPFKDIVEYIAKTNMTNNLEYLCIKIKDDYHICFPNFLKNKYYKGLEIEKKYTLEDLGLFNLER